MKVTGQEEDEILNAISQGVTKPSIECEDCKDEGWLSDMSDEGEDDERNDMWDEDEPWGL